MDEDGLRQAMAGIGAAARQAQRELARAPRARKDAALMVAATELRRWTAGLLAENAADVAAAAARGQTAALLDRLRLTEARVAGMAAALETVAGLPDPVGRELARWTRPNGLDIARVAVPLGLVGIVYESRPNVTADAAALCLKSGNAVILRGGSESARSNAAILACVQAGLDAADLPAAAVQAPPEGAGRAAVGLMLTMPGLLDVLIPRGGRSLVERVMAESRAPVLAHLDGNCHTYLHESADPAMAQAITVNAKLRRTGVCGATETLLCDRSVAARLLPPILDALIAGGCAIRGDAATLALEARATPATDADWDLEFLDAILAVRVVDGLDEAVGHIARHGSGHTDCIVATDPAAAEAFMARVDSAIVLHNASTQFADGGEFGMGAEIGIATGRLHARGPVGLEQLTTMQYQVRGSGQVRPG